MPLAKRGRNKATLRNLSIAVWGLQHADHFLAFQETF